MKTIRTRRQRETDYDGDEKQLLEILLFDGETSGVWLTFWDSEQIKVNPFDFFSSLKSIFISSHNDGYRKNILSFV